MPYTPGEDFVGVVDKLGEGVSPVEVGQQVAALPSAKLVVTRSTSANPPTV